MSKVPKVLAVSFFMLVVGVLTSTSLALSPDQKRVLDSGVGYFNVAKDDLVCNAGGASSVFFPSGVDVLSVEQKIATYITNTLPSSPLLAFAKDFAELGQQYNVNPSLLVALTQKETSLGTAGYGRPPKYNVTNIRGGSDGTGFNSYAGYREGIEAAYKNLRTDLYLEPPSSFTTVDQVINRWAPPKENDTVSYIDFVNDILPKIVESS